MANVGIVDDDRSIRVLVETVLRDEEVRVVMAEDAKTGLDIVANENLDALLLDINLPDGSGLELCEKIHQLDMRLPIIFITSDESGDTVIEAMKRGAYDFVAKPLEVARLIDVVRSAVDTRRKMNVEVAFDIDDGQPAAQDALIGKSAAMISVFRAIAQCAPQNITTLIRGESGTGKELVARAIYQHSQRSKSPFLAVNCAALHEGLLESELFGHEKGSFSGATSRRIGKFEQCDGGTIFLDEVGDMSLSVQAKVLRLIQQQEFQRLGGKETIKTDVRILSATNRPLEKMCDEGSFRLDLFHRLNGFCIFLPPLRERGGDIQTLIEYFVARAQQTLTLKNFEGISPRALELLETYSWPGNVRELEKVINQSLLALTGPILVEDFLPETILSAAAGCDDEKTEKENLEGLIRKHMENPGDVYAVTIEKVEKKLVEIVLQETGGNQSQAADMLGITRGKLRSRVKQFGLDLENLGESSDDE